ncbi:hypothetical protein PR202_ga23710 [Eleusine coracana subsp. coracana]|uniref:Uncharacterized protein n=1 Tax=Eleusine coracana subsp. coracana TaxID=191504 RepID=A0AAV5D7K0_ELECO|nr:hypothetical protein PR202_ga23710 [Eleusine coracana subsp. coracana]
MAPCMPYLTGGARDDAVRPVLQQPRRAPPARPHRRRLRRLLQLRQGRRQRVPGRRLLQGGRATRRMRDIHQLRHLAQHGLQPVSASSTAHAPSFTYFMNFICCDVWLLVYVQG